MRAEGTFEDSIFCNSKFSSTASWADMSLPFLLLLQVWDGIIDSTNFSFFCLFVVGFFFHGCFVTFFFFCQVLSKHIWSKILLLQLCIGEWARVRPVKLRLIQTQQWGKRDPNFGVTLMVPQIQVRVSRCFCPFFPQQWCYSGVRSHPSLLGQSRLNWLRLLSSILESPQGCTWRDWGGECDEGKASLVAIH